MATFCLLVAPGPPDVDECTTNNGGCDHTCENTYGTFKCICNEGYALQADGTTCSSEYKQ